MDAWYVVRTQPTAEIKAAQHLDRQGYRVYLPRWRKRRSHARRVDWVAAPLFPRYLFVGFDVACTPWRAIQSTIGVSQLILKGGMPAPVPDGIVDEIRSRETANGLVEVAPDYRRGDSLLIGEGPFLNKIGVFDGMSDSERVAVLLDLLGRQVRVHVPVYAVKAVA